MAFDPHAYSRLADLHESTDYANSRSVRTANKAADSMRKMVIETAESSPANHQLVYSLLDSDSRSARRWIACHILELFSPPLHIGQRAVRVLKSASQEDDMKGAVGFRYLLDNIRSAHPEYFEVE